MFGRPSRMNPARCSLKASASAPTPSMKLELRRRRKCRPMTYNPGTGVTPPLVANLPALVQDRDAQPWIAATKSSGPQHRADTRDAEVQRRVGVRKHQSSAARNRGGAGALEALHRDERVDAMQQAGELAVGGRRRSRRGRPQIARRVPSRSARRPTDTHTAVPEPGRDPASRDRDALPVAATADHARPRRRTPGRRSRRRSPCDRATTGCPRRDTRAAAACGAPRRSSRRVRRDSTHRPAADPRPTRRPPAHRRPASCEGRRYAVGRVARWRGRDGRRARAPRAVARSRWRSRRFSPTSIRSWCPP